MRTRILVAVTVAALGACCKSEDIPRQMSLLYSNNAKEKNQAALALAQCGKHASSAVPRLIELMYDPNVGVQSSSAYALRKIDTPAARIAIEKAEQSRRSKKSGMAHEN